VGILGRAVLYRRWQLTTRKQWNPVNEVMHYSEVKVIPLQARCGPEGGRGIVLLVHDRGTIRGEWSVARPGRILPPGKTRYPFYRRMGGPQGRSGRAKNPVPTGIQSRTVQLVASHYTDWATQPMSNVLYKLLIIEYFMRNVDILTPLILARNWAVLWPL